MFIELLTGLNLEVVISVTSPEAECAIGSSGHGKLMMLQAIRAELKAIQEWDKRVFPITTLVELMAVPIRAARKEDLIRKIEAIVAQN